MPMPEEAEKTGLNFNKQDIPWLPAIDKPGFTPTPWTQQNTYEKKVPTTEKNRSSVGGKSAFHSGTP